MYTYTLTVMLSVEKVAIRGKVANLVDDRGTILVEVATTPQRRDAKDTTTRWNLLYIVQEDTISKEMMMVEKGVPSSL